MDESMVQEILHELFSSFERMETQSSAILQFIKDKGIANDDELAPYLERAGNASGVRWLAARVRIDHLISGAMKAEEEKSRQEKSEQQQPKPEASQSSEKTQEAKPGEEASSEKGSEENRDHESKPADAKPRIDAQSEGKESETAARESARADKGQDPKIANENPPGKNAA
ncbi:MAG: hypothetical protein ABSF59_01960 [Candidatus Sulfotelmatobacter sp.]|jgi:sRNA-binding protein